jgi:hypothetical protein
MTAKSKEKVPTNHGFPMPEYRGTGFGQVYGTEMRVATGRRIPITVNGERVWMQVKEVRFVIHWAWTGTAWVTAEEWAVMTKRTAPAGTKFPSKHDFDFSGAPRKR